LEYVVEAVVAAGIDKLVLVVGYERDRIQTYFGDGDEWGIEIDYTIQDPQLGTGHAVQQLEPLVEEEFLVLNGDRIIDPEIITQLAEGANEAPAVAVTRVDSPARYGVVTLDGDHVGSIDEKPTRTPTSDIINAGVYRFTPSVFGAIERTDPAASGEITLPDTITTLAEKTDVQAVRYDGLWMDISQLWDLLSANDVLLDHQEYSADGTVAASAAVSERVCTDRDATIGPNATLRGGTTLGANVTVGANAVLSNTVVLQDATISDGAIVRDCIVSENATIGPGTTVTGGRTRVIIDGTVHEDVHLGGVIGDNAQIGGDVTIRAGTIIGDDVVINDSAVVEGRIEPRTVIDRG
jgi:glucose-1-phosphate thymidylyltransferase